MQTILFDLDGTLIDHFTTIHRCIVHVQSKLGLPQSDYATVRSTVGGSTPVTLERLLGEPHVAAALPLFRNYFDQIIFEDLQALPGSSWLLEALHRRGHPLAVFTNKFGDHSRATLQHLGMDRWLDAVLGTGDTPYRKPQAEFTAHMLQLLQADPTQTILIGDSPFDYAAAEAGGLTCYLVATGSHSVAELRQSTAAAGVYTDLYQLGSEVFNLQAATSQSR